MRHVKPLLPACSSRGLPSCIIMIDALFTIGSGAAVLTFARYAGSKVGTSAVGYWCCACTVTTPMSNVARKHIMVRMLGLLSVVRHAHPRVTPVCVSRPSYKLDLRT